MLAHILYHLNSFFIFEDACSVLLYSLSTVYYWLMEVLHVIYFWQKVYHIFTLTIHWLGKWNNKQLSQGLWHKISYSCNYFSQFHPNILFLSKAGGYALRKVLYEAPTLHIGIRLGWKRLTVKTHQGLML